MEDFSAVPAPEAQPPTGPTPPPPTRLRQTFDYIKQKKLPEVADALPDDYAQFEAGMADPDNVKALHSVFKEQKWEGAELDETRFADFVLAGVKKKDQSGPSSPPAGSSGAMPGPTTPAPDGLAPDEQMLLQPLPTGPAAHDEEFTNQPPGPAAVAAPAPSLLPAELPTAQQAPEGASVPVADVPVTPEAGQPTALPAALAQAIDQLPAAPQLDTVVSGDGRVLDVARKADDGFQPVDVTDLAGQLPPTAPVYRVMNGDQQRLYYDRPLSKVAAGDDHEQTPTEALNRGLYHELVSAVHGGAEWMGAAWREAARAQMAEDRATAGGGWRANTPAEDAQTSEANLPQVLADKAADWQQHYPHSPYYAAQKFSLTNPATYPKAIGQSAGLALPMVLSALVPESKLGAVAQRVLGVAFDSQLLDASPERAKEAGLQPGTPAYDRFVVADGTATLLSFKLGGAGLSAAGQQLVKTELLANVLAKLSEKAGTLTERELGEAWVAAAQKAAPVLRHALGEGTQMGLIGAGLAVKDEATGRAANALLGEQRFAEHTPGQLGEQMLSRGAELGAIGALSGAARGIGEVRTRTVALGKSPTRGQLFAELGEDGQPTRYLDSKGQEVDFGPAGPPPAVHQAVGAARERAASATPDEATTTPWNKLSHKEKKQRRSNYHLGDSTAEDAGYTVLPSGLHIDHDLPPHVANMLSSNPRLAALLDKLGIKRIENPALIGWGPTELGHANVAGFFQRDANGNGVVYLNPSVIHPTLRQLTYTLFHEAGHSVYESLTPEERAIADAAPQDTGAVVTYQDRRASGDRGSAASDAEENFADNLLYYLQSKQWGDAALLAKVYPPLKKIFDAKYGDSEAGKQSATPATTNASTPEIAPPADVAGPPTAVEPGAATGSVPVGATDTGTGTVVEASLPQNSQQITPVPAYATPAENRSNGRFEKDGQTYTRQAPLGEKVARGNATTAEFSTGVQQPVQYAVMEAADLQPSHTGGSANLNHFLPEAQPKNRSAAFDPASQKAIADIAAAPDLGRLGEAPNAYSGTPIVNGRGEALQGNGRGEGIRQHYAQGGASYKADVVAAAEKVGIPAEKTAGFKEPVLVRIADVSDQRARELGNYTAADTESGGKRRLDARQAAGRMSEEDRATLTRLATPRGDATLTETVRGNTEEILRFLRKAGLVNETQLQTLVKADGTLTPQGVEDIAALYRHQLFRSGDPNLPELFAELPGAAQGGLDRAVGALLGVPEAASLVPEVQNAIGGVREFVSSGADFNTWAGQADMFRGGAAPRTRYTPLELKLIELLASEKRPTYIARLFNEYAAAVKGEAASLFGETPPKPRAEAVQETFGVRDEPRKPAAGGDGRAEEGAPRPVDADRRPAPPVAPVAPGAQPAAQPAPAPAAAPNGAARAGSQAATAADAGPERGPVTVKVGSTDYVVVRHADGTAVVMNKGTKKILGERSVQYGQAKRAAEKLAATGSSGGGGAEPPVSSPQAPQEEGADSPEQQARAVRQRYEGTPQWLKAPNGEASNLSEQQWVAVRTPNFKRWFGEWEKTPSATEPNGKSTERPIDEPGGVAQSSSSGNDARGNEAPGPADATSPDRLPGTGGLLDRRGEPLVIFHGTGDAFDAFELGHPHQKDHGWLGRGVYATDSPRIASSYSRLKVNTAGERVMPLFGRMRNPYEATLAEKDALRNGTAEDAALFSARLQALGHDGVVLTYANGEKEFAFFEPGQLKSATDNSGAFDAGSTSLTDRGQTPVPDGTSPAEPAPVRPTQQRLEQLDSEYEQLKKDLDAAKKANPMSGQPLATLVPLPTITPAEAAVYVKMITNRLQKGVVKVADLLAELRASLGPALGNASDEDLTKVIQYAKDERQEEADLTRAAVVADLPRRQQELEQRLFGSVTATDADFAATTTGKATGVLSNRQEQLVSSPARALGARLNALTSRAAVSKNAFARELVYAVNAVSKGFVQTREQQLRSEAFIGQARERPAKEAQVLYQGFTERLRDPALTDPVAQGAALRTSLRRIDRVLDPAFYEARTRPGFEALLRERLDPVDFANLSAADIDNLFDEHTALLSSEQLAAAGKLEEADLDPREFAVYQDLKQLYNFVHDANFAIGRVSYTTWEAGRDMNTGEATYAARLYTPYELPDDLAPAWKKAMGTGGRKMETGLYQQREELEAWKLANKVEDPVFAAVKRLRQTMANRAIHDYGQWIMDTQPHLVVQPRNTGVKAREAARQEGESRGFVQLGEGYGALSNAWVAPHLAEDFKGAFFTNAFMQRIFEITKAYGSGDTSTHLVTGTLGKVRNVLKKSVTVYNPGTHMGNILNNVTLGWFAGVDGVSMAAEQAGAVKELKEYSPTVRYLLDRGVLGGSLASTEFKEHLSDFESAFAPAPPTGVVARGLHQMESFYQATDTVAKVALFRALVKQGLSAEVAADRVATALQNNKRVGKAYDVGANVPLVGQAFVRWSADLARILSSAAVNRPLSVAAFAVGLRVLGTQLSQASGETEAERRLREAGASRIPLPAWAGGNISTSLKVSKTSTVDLARWFVPFYLYGGYDDDGTLSETFSKFSPIWLKGGADIFANEDLPYTSNAAGRRAVTIGKWAQDPLLGPLAQMGLDADFRGKSITDPNASINNPSTATPLERSANQAHFFLRAALPGVGPLLDDVYQAARDRENYFGKKRSVGMTLARFLGFKMETFGKPQYYQALVRTVLTSQRQMEAELKLAGSVPDDVLKGMLNGSVNLHQLVPRLRYRSARFTEAYIKYAAAEQLAQDFLREAAAKPASPPAK